MGDRCYFTGRIHPDDLEEARPILEQSGEFDRTEIEAILRTGYIEEEQANYGFGSLTSNLTVARIRFHANHTEGGNYPAMDVGCDGEHEYSYSVDSCGQPSLSLTSGEPDGSDYVHLDAVIELNRMLRLESANRKAIEAAWEKIEDRRGAVPHVVIRSTTDG